MPATPFRNLRSASLTLLVATFAYSALAQGSTPAGAQVREHFERAQTALRANDPAAAEKEFREAIRIEPGFAQAHANLASLLASRGELDEARCHFKESLRLKPGYA